MTVSAAGTGGHASSDPNSPSGSHVPVTVTHVPTAGAPDLHLGRYGRREPPPGDAVGRARTMTGCPGNAIEVATRATWLTAGADSGHAGAAAGATPRRIRLAATGTDAHSHPGSTTPVIPATGTASGVRRQQPLEQRLRHERGDGHRHGRTEEEEGDRPHDDGGGDGPPGGDGRGVQVEFERRAEDGGNRADRGERGPADGGVHRHLRREPYPVEGGPLVLHGPGDAKGDACAPPRIPRRTSCGGTDLPTRPPALAPVRERPSHAVQKPLAQLPLDPLALLPVHP